MSMIDKAIAAVTPPESEKDRAEARAEATAAAEPGDWLSLVLDHHIELEDAIAAVEEAVTAQERSDAFKEFAVLLTGHSIAEEGVLYPGLSASSEAGHADMGYSEQAMVKIQMAALEKLDPLSQAFEDKLEHIKGALLHHMYEEEGNWFLDLKQNSSAEDQEMMTIRYAEEFDRYVGDAGIELEDDDELEE
jgi:hemerythrin superfamily protein